MQALACRDYVRREADALMLALGRFVWPVHILSAGLLSALLWRYAPAGLLLSWAVWVVVFSFVQGAICLHGTGRARAGAHLGQLPLAFDLTAVLLAIAWAWLALVLFPRGSLEMQNFVGFMIGGAVLTGVGTHNMHYRILAVNLLLILPALAGRMLFEYGWGQGSAIAGMLLVFLGLMLALGWMLHSMIRRGFVLQWEKTDLAHRLEVQAGALEAARAEAVAANAAKSRFLAQASHDLRQPIHSMGLFLAALPRGDLPARARDILGRVEQSVDALSKSFNALLDIALLDTGQTRPSLARFAVSDTIADITEEFALSAEADSVALRIEPSALIVHSDPLILRRILQNLIANALRHADCTEIRIAARPCASGIALDVSDNGRGIAEADRARIFEAFSSLRPGSDPERGVGLGLFIVRRLCDALGVRVEVGSRDTRGTVFTVGPFPEASAVDEAGPPQSDIFSERPVGRVLVVDDDASIRESTRALLYSWGWRVDACADVSEAVARELDRPALVIADYDLGPGRTGLDAIAAIRSIHGFVPALIVSGDSSPRLGRELADAGFVLLHKPLRPVQLRSAILGVLG